MTDGCDISNKIALRWTSLDLSDDKSTLVQVMAWCRQAKSHYLNQCWPRSLPPYGIIRPQWVKKGVNRMTYDSISTYIFFVNFLFYFARSMLLKLSLMNPTSVSQPPLLWHCWISMTMLHRLCLQISTLLLQIKQPPLVLQLVRYVWWSHSVIVEFLENYLQVWIWRIFIQVWIWRRIFTLSYFSMEELYKMQIYIAGFVQD